MEANNAASLLSAVVALVFALTVLDQYLDRRRPYQLLWTIGLLLYSLATGSQFVIGAFGLSPLAYRLWYLSGAVLVAAYLGMGAFYLHLPHRAAHGVMIVLSLGTLYAIFRVFSAEINLVALEPGAFLTGKAMPGSVRVLTPIFNVFGTAGLVGGAVYSAWHFWRLRVMLYRVVSNVLIAVGAFLPALGGTLTRFGMPDPHYVLQFLGVLVIFIGFLRSNETFGVSRIPLFHAFRGPT